MLFDSPQAVREFLKVKLGVPDHEMFAVLMLDSQNRLIEYLELFRGSVSQTSVYPRDVVIYGARRVWRDVLERGQICGLHSIERLMREQALRARPRRRGLPKDRSERSAVADNVLDRQF